MENYRIQVLDYGYVETFPADFAFDGSYRSGEFFFSPFCMTLIRGNGKTILVDCGVDMRDEKHRNHFIGEFGQNGHDPIEVLATVGVRPEDIDAVVLTHVHWDHIGGLACFPRAEVYVQREELEMWEQLMQQDRLSDLVALPVDGCDLRTLRRLESEGRVRLLDGESDDLFPGVHIRVSRLAHSFSQQIVLVENRDKTYVIVGDTCNRPENIFGAPEHPGFLPGSKFAIGAVYNTLQSYERILEWTESDASRLVPTHDGTRHERFPSRKSALGLYISDITPSPASD